MSVRVKQLNGIYLILIIPQAGSIPCLIGSEMTVTFGTSVTRKVLILVTTYPTLSLGYSRITFSSPFKSLADNCIGLECEANIGSHLKHSSEHLCLKERRNIESS